MAELQLDNQANLLKQIQYCGYCTQDACEEIECKVVSFMYFYYFSRINIFSCSEKIHVPWKVSKD